LTHKSFAANVLKAFGAKKTDVFAELRVNSEKDKAKVQPLLTEVLKARKFSLPLNDVSHRAGKCNIEEKDVQMWKDVEGCFEQVLQAEAEDSKQYDWVFRARPNMVWYGATAPLTQFDPKVISTAEQEEHFFLTPRHLAEAAFQSVMQKYRRCAQGKDTFTAREAENMLGLALQAEGVKHRVESERFRGVVAYQNAEHPHAKQRCSDVETPFFRQELCMRTLYGDRPESSMDFTNHDECSRPQTKNLLANEETAGKKVLILTPLKNAEDRLERYVATLNSFSYPKKLLSVGLLVSDSNDHTLEDAQNLYGHQLRDFASVHVFRKDFHYKAPEDRHSFEVQAARRKILAQSRNELVKRAMTDDISHVLWLDVDITGLPPSLIQDMIAVGKPIVAPHVRIEELTYDRNSWRENHPEAFVSKEGPAIVFEGYEETKGAGGARDYLDDLQVLAQASGLQDKMHAVPLDGVGTAVLFVDAKVHRHKDVFFPEVPYKKRLESEGFGLLAKDHGFAVCGLPLYQVQHFDEWNIERALQEDDLWGEEPGMNKTKKKPACATWCSRGEHKDTPWDDKCTWKACGKCRPCSGESLCDGICTDYRNGAMQGDEMLCVGPKEPQGTPCYPAQVRQGSDRKECPSDMKFCDRPVKTPKEPKPEPKPKPRPTPKPSPKDPKDPKKPPPKKGNHSKVTDKPPKKRVKKLKKAKMKMRMKIKNVDFKKLPEEAKTKLKEKIAKIVAKKAGVPVEDVEIVLSAGSVQVEANIDLSSKVQEDASEDDVKAQAAAVDLGGLDAEIIAEAKEIPGVAEAATGVIEAEAPTYDVDVEVEEVEVDDTPAATTSPSTVTDEDTGMPDKVADSAKEYSLTASCLALAAVVVANL
jgi:hypothetical protein